MPDAKTTAGFATNDPAAPARKTPIRPAERDWDATSLSDICAFIVDHHHAYTRSALERLSQLCTTLRTVHTRRDPELVQIHLGVAGLIGDLLPHMYEEEEVIFPYLADLESSRRAGRVPPQPLLGPLRDRAATMAVEHEAASSRIAQMRRIIDGWVQPAGSGAGSAALIALLVRLEEDLFLHARLEDQVLFTRGVALEAETGASAHAGVT